MLDAAAGVDGVGRPVMTVDQISCSTGGVTGDATCARGRGRIGAADKVARTGKRLIYTLKSSGPSVLREIVVEHAKAGADHGLTAISRGICDAEARAELCAVVVRHAHRNL